MTKSRFQYYIQNHPRRILRTPRYHGICKAPYKAKDTALSALDCILCIALQCSSCLASPLEEGAVGDWKSSGSGMRLSAGEGEKHRAPESIGPIFI